MALPGVEWSLDVAPPVIEAVRATPPWSEYRALAHTWPRETADVRDHAPLPYASW